MFHARSGIEAVAASDQADAREYQPDELQREEITRQCQQDEVRRQGVQDEAQQQPESRRLTARMPHANNAKDDAADMEEPEYQLDGKAVDARDAQQAFSADALAKHIAGGGADAGIAESESAIGLQQRGSQLLPAAQDKASQVRAQHCPYLFDVELGGMLVFAIGMAGGVGIAARFRVEQGVILGWGAVVRLRPAPQGRQQLVADDDKAIPQGEIIDRPGGDDGGVDDDQNQA